MKNIHLLPTSQSSCEKVEAIQTCIIGCEKLIINGENSICCGDYTYKIIPQEEPKQKNSTLNIDILKSKVDNALANETKKSLTEWLETQRNKQETLEEAAEKYVENFSMFVKSARQIGFIDGAKFQAERMYSEEEVLKLLIIFSDNRTFLKKDVAINWFEQNKKKQP